MYQQAPLRDTYISCTEPVNPYHGNYVVVSLTKPYCLNLPLTVDNLWEIQTSSWHSIGSQSPGSLSFSAPSWADMSRNFIMPTYCVRTWSNTSYWWDPDYYYTPMKGLNPLPRSSNYVEPQLGSIMYMQALLLCLGKKDTLPYRYSEYGVGVLNGDSYYYNASNDSTQPFWVQPPTEYSFLNENLPTSLSRIAGFNLTCFAVEVTPTYLSKPKLSSCPSTSMFRMTLKPIVPFADLSGCWLNPPMNYTNYMNHQDWDGRFTLETTNGTAFSLGSPEEQLSVLPAITVELTASAHCVDVILPLQLYTLVPVDSTFTFSLQDVSNGTPAYRVNTEVVATRVRGYFWDNDGDPTTAGNASSIHFEVANPTKVHKASHTFFEKNGNHNRPFYCTETDSIPILNSPQFASALMFVPQCGPGMWTNLPQNNL